MWTWWQNIKIINKYKHENVLKDNKNNLMLVDFQIQVEFQIKILWEKSYPFYNCIYLSREYLFFGFCLNKRFYR